MSVEGSGVEGAGGSGSAEVVGSRGLGGVGVWRSRERGLGGVGVWRSRRVVMNAGCLPPVRKPDQCERDGDFQRSVPRLMSLLSCGLITFLAMNLQHMALLLYGRLPTIFGLSKTDTAAVVGEVLHKNKRTIRRWVEANGGELSESQQGHYVRNNTLMSNEELCERARAYVRENAAP